MAGHIFFKDEDGVYHTNSGEHYLGLDNALYIWHGEWSDPEILYTSRSGKQYLLNYWAVDEALSDYYKAYKECTDEPWPYDMWVYGFDVECLLMDMAWAQDECNNNNNNND